MTVYLGGPKDVTDAALLVVKQYSATQLFIGEWGAPAKVKIVSNMVTKLSFLVTLLSTLFMYICICFILNSHFSLLNFSYLLNVTFLQDVCCKCSGHG